MAYLLLTGCTGLVGRYLLRDLLASDVPVAVIVRPDKVAGARQRVEGVMSHWEREAGRAMARPVVLEGDLCQAGVVSTEQREWLTEHCQTLLHCAASMTFRENQRGEPSLIYHTKPRSITPPRQESTSTRPAKSRAK
jgi:thioester reductase-like protein